MTRTFTLAALATLALTAPAVHAQDVINFDAFPSPPPRTSLAPLFLANNNNRTFDGVTFPQSAFVIGDQSTNGSGQPSVAPYSGFYAFDSGNVQTTTLDTTKTLYGLYLGQINNGNAASSVTIQAFGNGHLLKSITAPLNSTTLSFVDTSAFATLSGIAGYSLVAQGPAGTTGKYDFAGDDFTFSAPPPPPVYSGLFDFDTDSIGTGANPTQVHTTFADSSGGISATFSTTADDAGSGGYGVQNSTYLNAALSGNYLATPSGAGKYNLPLSVAFDRTLQSGSIVFGSSPTTSPAGTFTVQELLNGAVVGTITASRTSQGTLSFLSGVSYNGLTITDTSAVYGIDNLSVSTAAPEPSQFAAFGIGLLGLGVLTFKARRRTAV